MQRSVHPELFSCLHKKQHRVLVVLIRVEPFGWQLRCDLSHRAICHWRRKLDVQSVRLVLRILHIGRRVHVLHSRQSVGQFNLRSGNELLGGFLPGKRDLPRLLSRLRILQRQFRLLRSMSIVAFHPVRRHLPFNVR
jgi:hypothetical protein